MKTTVLWALVVINALLLASLIGRFATPNSAIAQPAAQAPARPGDFLLIPAQVSGVSSGLVVIVDTTNGRLSAMTYDESRRRIDSMQSVDLAGVFQRVGAEPRPR